MLLESYKLALSRTLTWCRLPLSYTTAMLLHTHYCYVVHQVNGELEALESGLAQAQALVKPGGRIVVLSYHSLEDRRVKRMLASGNLRNNQLSKDMYGNKIAPWEALTRKPIVPSEAEIVANPRARSVKMRVAARTKHP
jgi:16S rRNA (cytosine1402-N4)-methyltransferase